MKNRIEELIKKLKVSGYRFAQDTDIPQNTVYRLKNNPKHFPSSDVCDRIIKAYPQVKIQDIVEAENVADLEAL
jgi:predicted transcriptional regulator